MGNHHCRHIHYKYSCQPVMYPSPPEDYEEATKMWCSQQVRFYQKMCKHHIEHVRNLKQDYHGQIPQVSSQYNPQKPRQPPCNCYCTD